MYCKTSRRFKAFLTLLVSMAVLVLGLVLHALASEGATAYAQGNEPTATSMSTPTAPVASTSTLIPLPNINGSDNCVPGGSTNPGTPTLISAPEARSNLCIIENDNQYYQFTAKIGKVYEISTNADKDNIDTHLYLYRETVSEDLQNYIEQNDDESNTSLDSRLTYQAPDDNIYIVRIQNKSIVTGTYTLAINLAEPTPPAATNTPGTTSTPEARIEFDDYEDNYDFDTAYVIAADSDPEAPETIYSLNFVPVSGNGPDNDFFKLWVKTGGTYTCATSNLSSYNDTNMIIYDQNRNGLAGNDDEAVGVLSSKVIYHATYTGWLYVLVGPNVEVNYNVSDQYEYDLNCTSTFAPPTAIPQPTSPPLPPVQAQPAATPGAAPEVVSGVVTVMPDSQQIASVDETARQITITPLETVIAPVAPAAGSFTVAIHRAPENATENNLPKGVGNMPVALYDAGGNLLAFGFTNTQGDLAVDIVSRSEITVVIPYWGLQEVVSYPEFTLLEITSPSLEMNEEDDQ